MLVLKKLCEQWPLRAAFVVVKIQGLYMILRSFDVFMKGLSEAELMPLYDAGWFTGGVSVALVSVIWRNRSWMLRI